MPTRAVDDLVEVGIARVVVARGVSAIAVDVEHLGVQMAKAEDRRLTRRTARFDARRKAIQLVEIPRHIEARILLERDEQRSLGEVGVRNVALGILAELSSGLGGVDQHGQ